MSESKGTPIDIVDELRLEADALKRNGGSAVVVALLLKARAEVVRVRDEADLIGSMYRDLREQHDALLAVAADAVAASDGESS